MDVAVEDTPSTKTNPKRGVKKKLVVVPKPPSGQLLVIKYEGGGELPEQLKGTYTRYETAEAAITNYENSKK